MCARLAETLIGVANGQSSGGPKTNPIIVGRKLIGSVFRIFDEDKDGNIQISELVNIFSSWISTIFTLVVETLDMIEDLLFDDAVTTAASQIGQNLEFLPRDSNGSIIIDQALRTLLENVPDQASEAVASQVTSTTDMAKQQARSLVPDIDDRFAATTALYNGLVARLGAMAVNGTVSKDLAVDTITPVCCEIIENVLALDVVARAKKEPLDQLNSVLRRNSPFPDGLPASLVDDLINTVVVSLRTFFRSGGLKQFLQVRARARVVAPSASATARPFIARVPGRPWSTCST